MHVLVQECSFEHSNMLADNQEGEKGGFPCLGLPSDLLQIYRMEVAAGSRHSRKLGHLLSLYLSLGMNPL